MAELLINIPDAKEGLLKELVVSLGGIIMSNKFRTQGKVSAKKYEADNKIPEGIEVLFGTWEDTTIDARKLREEAWGRKF